MSDPAAYLSLFAAAFLAATLLPGSSEAVLTALLLEGSRSPWVLLAVASCGNVLGSVANWLCGRYLSTFRDRRWFPVSERRYDQAKGWFERYGLWSLLFAWAPIVGDPLTVIAGALRTPIAPFIVLVGIGKIARYAFIVGGVALWQS